MIFNGVIQVAGGGGGTKAAHGTTSGSGSSVLTVNGLGFKPSYVSIFVDTIFLGNEEPVALIAHTRYSPITKSDGYYNYLLGGDIFHGSDDLSVSFLEDGFSVTVPEAIFTNKRDYGWSAFE